MTPLQHARAEADKEMARDEPKIVTKSGKAIRVRAVRNSWADLKRVEISASVLSVTIFDRANATAPRDALNRVLEQQGE